MANYQLGKDTIIEYKGKSFKLAIPEWLRWPKGKIVECPRCHGHPVTEYEYDHGLCERDGGDIPYRAPSRTSRYILSDGPELEDMIGNVHDGVMDHLWNR